MAVNLTVHDTQKLLLAIQELHALHDLSSFGSRTLAIVNQLVESDVPLFALTNLHTRAISYTFLPDFPGFTAEMEQIPRRYWQEHPIVQNMPITLSGAYKISDFITPAEFQRLEGLCHQFLRQIDCKDQMTLFLPPSKHGIPSQTSEAIVTLALNRHDRTFTERDRTLLNLLRPHLFQAYCNAQHYEQLTSITHCLGIVVLNTIGQVQFMTSLAVEYLHRYFTHTSHSLPDLLSAWVRHQIQKSSMLHSIHPLHIEQENKRLMIRLILDQPGARYLLLLEEQTVSPPPLHLLGLSAREAQVLLCVMHGKDNQAIAHDLEIHSSTVRKHLESIYRKLNVQSRTEAIAQVLERLGMLNVPPSL